MANPGHSGRRWRTLRAHILATSDVCWLCGQPLDKTLAYPHPMSPSVDYRIPWSLGGRMEPANLFACHLTCNRRRGQHQPAMTTTREW